MIIRSYLVTLWAVLFVGCGPTVAQSIAVFDFELIDTSLEGAIRGARPDEQERLAHLSDQLRQLLRDSGRFSLVDITPIAREAQASNLQACGGCDMHLAQRSSVGLFGVRAFTLSQQKRRAERRRELIAGAVAEGARQQDAVILADACVGRRVAS